MSELSKRMRELVKAAESANQSTYCDVGMTSADGELFDAVRPCDGSSGLLDLCDEVERLEAENASLSSQLIDVDFSLGELLSAEGMARAEAEHERDRLRAENAELRAKLAERYDPVSALDAACRASGLPLGDDYEQRLSDWRAYLDAPVDPAPSHEIAAPKSHPPEDHSK